MLDGKARLQQISSYCWSRVKFDRLLGLLVDKEYLLRENRRLTRRLQEARLKVKAEVEDVDFQTPRGLNKGFYLELANGGWLRRKHNCIMTGPTGCGKTYLACAWLRKHAVKVSGVSIFTSLTWYGTWSSLTTGSGSR